MVITLPPFFTPGSSSIGGVQASGTQNSIITNNAKAASLPQSNVQFAQATVVGKAPNGNPIINLPQVGNVTIQTQLNLVVGQQLTLQVLNLTAPRPEASANNPAAAAQTQAAAGAAANPASAALAAKVLTVNGKPPEPPKGSTPQERAVGEKGAASDDYRFIRSTGASAPASAAQKPQTDTATKVSTQAVNVQQGTFLDAVVVRPVEEVNTVLQPLLPQVQGVVEGQAGASVQPQEVALKPADGLLLQVVSVSNPREVTASDLTNAIAPSVAGKGGVVGEDGDSTAARQEAATRAVVGQEVTQQSKPEQNTTQANTAKQVADAPKAAQANNYTPYSTTLLPTALEGEEQVKQVADTAAPKIPIGNQFSAQVIGTERSGEIVLNTPLGVMKLAPGLALQPNTELQVAIANVQLRSPLTSEATALLHSHDVDTTTGFTRYPAFEQFMAIALGLSAELSDPSIARNVPDVRSSDFIARLLWFFFNAGKGNAEQFAGKDVQHSIKQAGYNNILASMGQEFTQIARSYADPYGQYWHHMLFPVYDGERLHYGHFYLRKDNKRKTGDEGDEDGARFIIEVDLSLTGPMQLDGLTQKTDEGKSLDLNIRTKDALPKHIQSDILQLFTDTTAIIGIEGALHFHVNSRFPTDPFVEEQSKPDSESGSIIA